MDTRQMLEEEVEAVRAALVEIMPAVAAAFPDCPEVLNLGSNARESLGRMLTAMAKPAKPKPGSA